MSPSLSGSLEGLASDRYGQQVWLNADDGTKVEGQQVRTTDALSELVPEDVEESAVAQAQSGDVDMAHSLCFAYLYGEEVERDLAEASRWCLAGAQGGNLSSQVLLAQILESGEDQPKDLEAAFHWYSKAAEQDHLHAKLKAGLMLVLGEGCEADAVAGTQLIRDSANGGYFKALEIVRQIAVADAQSEGEQFE